jgi:hypothetical protein
LVAALLGELVTRAASHGIRRLRARMLAEQDWIIKMLARHGTWTSAFARGVRDVTLELATAETEVAPAAEAPAAEAPAAEAPGGSGGRTRDRLSSGILCEGEHDQRVTAAGWLARIPGDWLSGRALP